MYVLCCGVGWGGVGWLKYVQVVPKGMHSVSSPYASYDMLNKSLFDKNSKVIIKIITRMRHTAQLDSVSTQLRASSLLKYGAGQGVMNHRIYQRKVGVDILNAIKSVFADPSDSPVDLPYTSNGKHDCRLYFIKYQLISGIQAVSIVNSRSDFSL